MQVLDIEDVPVCLTSNLGPGMPGPYTLKENPV